MAIKEDIERAQARLEANDKRIERCRSVLHRKRDNRDELLRALKDARGALAHARAVRDELRDKGGLNGETWGDERIAERRESIADKIEDATATRDQLIEQLDANATKSKRIFERLGNWIAYRSDGRKQLKRLRRKRKRLAEDKKGRLTKDFHVAEFDCNDGTPVPAAAIPGLKRLCEEHLQPLRDSGDLVSINSGFRHAAYNASIGGASQSYHIYNLNAEHLAATAADHVQSGRPAPAVQTWHDTHNSPPAMGYYSGFTHIDRRPYRVRWYGAA